MIVFGWLIAMAVLLVIEIATLGLTTLWFAIGALAAFIAAVLNLHIGVQTAIFIVVSLVLLIFTRPWALKYLNSRTSRTNADSLVGKKARVTKTIDNIAGEGQVVINGMEWTARSLEDEVKIAEGAVVIINKISGVKLIVSKMKEG
ncbi:membrane protein implicated in regulation of membrane protease activity [Catenibacillus scindens]|uniref:Membrane protein implicated in regulation of membrane protease activity n=1 Tax=Catenibacillus scindens TaxID=673271 RepID=A0A7W8M3X9_9FIRM|nr:NfeD family protein [Catenibacillus scindens]MBB5262987.1 membrane protein implicated in regulation of membrane protease activity [Catenibacillus scindens]